jgi:surfactin family lipopeptide synthetase A
LFASLIGILMAGCAYIPVLPSFPTKRIVHMLETAGAVLLLCDAESRRALSAALPCRLLVLSDAHAAFAPPEGRTSTDLIHILFTSGSTGRPKGVMLTHRSIANLLPNIRAVMEDVRDRSCAART